MDEIRVLWAEYKGIVSLTSGIYTEIEGKADKVPTKKGVTLGPELIPEELIKALEGAAVVTVMDKAANISGAA